MRSKPMILVALLLAAFAINLDTTLVNVALPSLVRELHATTTQLQWVVDAYNLVFAALLLTFGSLSDRLGRKGMLLAGLATFGAASLAGGFTTSPAQLIAARAVMGLGAAMTFPATLSLISNVFRERRERARAIGLWGAVAGVAIALGPIAGGWLLEHFSWPSIFLMTQYFQFVRGYGPLSTGVHLLPVALSVGAFSVAGTQLAVRAGTKLVVTLGLIAMTAFYGWVAAATTATISYGIIAVQMVLYGLGMGLTSAPATESIMGAISRRLAGVGSAVNDTTRLLGGTLGVAVIGSVYASLYGSRLTARLPAGLPPAVSAVAHQSVGAAYAVSARIPGPLGAAVHGAATNAFLHGLSIGCLVSGRGRGGRGHPGRPVPAGPATRPRGHGDQLG